MVTRTKKIFVGGLSASTVQADLTSYFSTFGKVEEAMLMFDRQANGIDLFFSVILVSGCLNSTQINLNLLVLYSSNVVNFA